jgi:hypothetical protein
VGIELSVQEESFGVGDQSWMKHRAGWDRLRPITLDLSYFADEHKEDGRIKSGILLGMNATTQRYGPYSPDLETVTLTVGGSGLTSFTLTYGGQTTGSIVAAATAAQVQAALELLSNVRPGDFIVTGSAGGPWTVVAAGDQANLDIGAITTTPTGGTGTVTAAVTNSGGGTTNGLQVPRGHLFADVQTLKHNVALTQVAAALFWTGIVDTTRLPNYVDTGAGLGMLDAYARQVLGNQIRYEPVV